MAHDVFISHSSEDKPIADAVCAILERNQIRCWIAPRDVLPGAAFGEAIIDAITGSRVMILVFSNASNSSSYVMREVERAVSKEVPIIPFRIANVTPSKSMEFFLSAPHWLDAMSPPIESHLRRLVDVVQLFLSAEDSSAKALELNKTDEASKPQETFQPAGVFQSFGNLLDTISPPIESNVNGLVEAVQSFLSAEDSSAKAEELNKTNEASKPQESFQPVGVFQHVGNLIDSISPPVESNASGFADVVQSFLSAEGKNVKSKKLNRSADFNGRHSKSRNRKISRVALAVVLLLLASLITWSFSSILFDLIVKSIGTSSE